MTKAVFSRFCRHQAGSAALELVIILPVILAFIFALVDISRLLIADSAVLTGATRISRQLSYLPKVERAKLSTTSMQDQLRAAVAAQGTRWLQLDSLSIVQIGDTSPAESDDQGFVVYKLSYQFAPVAPFAFSLLGTGILNRSVILTVQSLNGAD